MVANGCDGVTLFGTTGEGYGFSLPERHAILTALAEALPDRTKIHAGVLNHSIDDAVKLAQAAFEDGLFSWFGTAFEKLDHP
ncbi:dihydrodipicolinate synthase family protein [Parasedimentitalea huanghaiensis]|uniref:dihydrodipicolinate synthase family protein n=1 Tax=Parasedimentitalea huanghaiensis TaxID=2682100 RepID=UPI00142F7C36